jgi:hypothetical protein
MSMQPPSSLIELSIEAIELEKAALLLGEDAKEIVEYLNQIRTDLASKSDSYCFTMERLKNSSQLLKEKADQFLKASRTLDNLHKQMKDRIKESMRILGKNEIKGDHMVFKLTENAPRLEIDPSYLPSEYKKEVIEFEIDKEKIEADTKQGIVITGVTLNPSFTLRTTVNKGKEK